MTSSPHKGTVSARLKRQVIRALPWSFAEGLVNGFAGLGLTFILAWFLEPKELGQAAIALSIVGLIDILAGLGMIEALIGARSADTRASDTAFTAVMVSSLAATGLCWAFSDAVGKFYGDPLIARLIEAASLMLPINALAAVPTALLTRKMRAGTLTSRMMASRVVTVTSIGALALLGFGAWAPVVGTLLGSVAAVLVLSVTMSRWPRVRFDSGDFRGLLAFGAALSVERLTWSAMIRLFWLIIGYVHGPATLGYFQFAQRFIDESASLVQTFSIRFGLSFFAALERAGKDPADAYLRATRLVTVVAAPIFAGLALVMPDVVATFFDPKWAPAAIVGQITALGWVMAFPRVLVGPALRARGRQSVLVTYSIISCATTLLGGMVTGGQSLFVVALVWISHQSFGVPWSLYALNRHLGISPRRQVAAYARPLVSTAIMACAVLTVEVLAQDWTPIMRLPVLVLTGAATYAIAVALIDRTTLRLGRSIVSDMRQLRRAAT